MEKQNLSGSKRPQSHLHAQGAPWFLASKIFPWGLTSLGADLGDHNPTGALPFSFIPFVDSELSYRGRRNILLHEICWQVGDLAFDASVPATPRSGRSSQAQQFCTLWRTWPRVSWEWGHNAHQNTQTPGEARRAGPTLTLPTAWAVSEARTAQGAWSSWGKSHCTQSCTGTSMPIVHGSATDPILSGMCCHRCWGQSWLEQYTQVSCEHDWEVGCTFLRWNATCTELVSVMRSTAEQNPGQISWAATFLYLGFGMTAISSHYYTANTEVLFPNHNKWQQNSKPNPGVSFPLKKCSLTFFCWNPCSVSGEQYSQWWQCCSLFWNTQFCSAVQREMPDFKHTEHICSSSLLPTVQRAQLPAALLRMLSRAVPSGHWRSERELAR